MKKYFHVIIMSVAALLTLGGLAEAAGRTLRIGVVNGAATATISGADYSRSRDYAALFKKNGLSQDFTSRLECYGIGTATAIAINGKKTGAKRFKVYPKKDSFTKIDGNPYRGHFEIFVAKNSIFVVNVVDSEDYLKSLLACEMEPESDIEALKAQAVVARTYAFATAGKHKNLGYDLCNRDCCQVYRGTAHETPKTVKAVSDTAGTAIYHRGRLITAYYCSSCGGRTESVEEAWPGADSIRYLKVVACSYCKKDDRVKWTYRISKREFIAKMRSAGFPLADIRSASTEDRTGSGRFYTMTVDTPAGKLYCSVDVIRKIFGGSKIKSSQFEVTVENARRETRQAAARTRIDDIIGTRASADAGGWVTFTGSGHGHGVGMCQNGAKRMASSGKRYGDIVRHYFSKEIELKRIY